MTQTYALLAFQFVAFLIILYLMNHMYRQLRRDAGATGRVRSDVDDLVLELRRTADQINADISARTATLQRLVDEADDKLRRIDTITSRAEAQRQSSAAAARAAVAAAPRPPTRPPTTRPAIQPPADAPRRPAPSRPEPTPAADGPWPGAPMSGTIRAVPPVAAGSPAAANAYRQASRVGEKPKDDGFVGMSVEDTGKFQTVRRLAAEGLSAGEIARRTQMEREEVELIMQLAGDARP